MEIAFETSVHEAAHGVVLMSLGGNVEKLSVSADGLSGQCVPKGSWNFGPLESRRAVIKYCFAGPVASARTNGTGIDLYDPKFKSDRQMIENEVNSIYAFFLNEGKPEFPLVSVVAKTELLASEEVLAAHWTAVWTIARELSSARSMTGTRAKQIFCDAQY